MHHRWFLSGAAVIAAASALYFLHVRLTSSDLPFYRRLVQESIDLHAYSALEKSPVRQMRKEVRKDIWDDSKWAKATHPDRESPIRFDAHAKKGEDGGN